MVHNIIIINLLIRRLYGHIDSYDYYDIVRYGDPSNLLYMNYPTIAQFTGVALLGSMDITNILLQSKFVSDIRHLYGGIGETP
jgi:hypothetical protein